MASLSLTEKFEVPQGADSASLLEGVMAAREFMAWREEEAPQAAAAMKGFMAHMEENRALKLWKIARTIADLEQSQDVRDEHIIEASTLLF